MSGQRGKAHTCPRCFNPCVVCNTTDTCWADTRPATNASDNSGKPRNSRPVATTADPACTVDPVAADPGDVATDVGDEHE